MLELILTVLAVTATWRVAAMVARERGPGDAFVALRSAVHERYGERSWQGEGIGCPLCISFWAALPFGALLWVALPVPPWFWPVGWLGVAGAAALLFTWEPR